MTYTKVDKKKKKMKKYGVGVSTRNRVKADCGPPQSAGNKSNRWQREHECLQNIVDG